MSPRDRNQRSITILMADDDQDDRELILDALAATNVANEIRFVNDGEELMEYLRLEGAYRDRAEQAPRPAIILLDLNMPKKDGREALAEIKADPELRQIPVVILTTSRDEEDVLRSYDLGVNSFITKPVTFTALADVMNAWARYWLQIVELPSSDTYA